MKQLEDSKTIDMLGAVLSAAAQVTIQRALVTLMQMGRVALVAADDKEGAQIERDLVNLALALKELRHAAYCR